LSVVVWGVVACRRSWGCGWSGGDGEHRGTPPAPAELVVLEVWVVPAGATRQGGGEAGVGWVCPRRASTRRVGRYPYRLGAVGVVSGGGMPWCGCVSCV